MVIECKAWDLMGEHYEKINWTHRIRIKGGRALYDNVINTKTGNICLRRLEPAYFALPGLKVYARYIKWDTIVELVPIEGDESTVAQMRRMKNEKAA